MENYTQKLTFKDALVIRHEISIPEIKPSDLPLLIMSKIMACDTKCRSILVPFRIPKNEYYVCQDENSEDEDNSDSAPEDYNDTDQFYIVHPLDIIMILLHCSNNFLRHELFSKLFSCQIAVPLLLPDEIKNSLTLMLWALRSIKKSWKSVDCYGKAHTKNCSVVDHKGAIVSFLKCGKKLSKSKSKLLNDVIGSENIFFHWDLLKEQNCYKIISQGVVELCCYYPGKKDPIFKDAVIFTNLRGDAVQYPKQLAFIQKISFISCILITKKGLNKKQNIDILKTLAKTPGGIIVLLADSKSYKEDYLKQIIGSESVSLVSLKGKASAVIESEIRHLISTKVESFSQQFKSISNYIEIAHEHDIEIDEDDEDCVLGKKAALQMEQTIKGVKFTEVKNHFLLLQGAEMWQKWAAHEKEYHRHKERRGQSLTDYRLVKEQEKDKTKLCELQYINSTTFSPLIKEFLHSLLQCVGNCKSYFLQWLRMFLDNLSKDTLLKLQIDYQNTRSEIQKVSTTDTGRIKELKELSKHQNSMLINASVGTEHFFREIGQIYETVIFKDKHSPLVPLSNFDENEIKHLPMIAAKTLVEGFAMEIMDGEASHIQLTWVQAVIRCLKQMFKDKKLFVLSILGLQSSGKSTLLNTMFGLRFNVSVSRCTRGAFFQLLFLDDELKKELHCDFIVIVDTEGICAPELLIEGSEQHDNELATFVIGLADFTIINVRGTIHANLNDILQTVLHAFMRMKEVDKNPGCLFVHQNVTEQFAAENLQPGRQIFLDQLNNLTQAVANIEHCDTKYQKFQDVIEFDEKKDVYYFSNLWKGDPPMAPINVGYSECAQELKRAVLRLIKDHQKFRTFETFAIRIESLWTAILQENFIFSFKNAMEVTAYRELELEYGEWIWKLQMVLRQQLLVCENRIKSCGKQDSSNSIQNSCINDSIKILNMKCDELYKELTSFIEKHDFGSIMSKWHLHIKDRLKETKEGFITTIRQHCDRLVCKKKNDKENEELQQQYKEKLREEITELVAQLGSNKTADSVEISEIFDSNWNKWIAKFREKVIYPEYASDEDIKIHLESNLANNLQAEYLYFNQKSTIYPLTVSDYKESSFMMIVESEVHINIKRRFVSPYTWYQTEAYISKMCTTAQEETNRILAQMKRRIQEITDSETKKQGFTPDLPDTVFKELIREIVNFNKSSHDFSFTSEYKVDIALVVCRYAAHKFKCWTDSLKRENDPILALQKQKSKFLTIFTNRYCEVANEIAAANEMCSLLIDSIANSAVNKLPVSLVSHLKATNTNFNSKSGFKVQILNDLAEKGVFSEYKAYIKNSSICFEEWAQRYISHYFIEGSKKLSFEKLAKQEIFHLIFTVTEAIEHTDISCNTDWLNNVCDTLNGIIEINKQDMCNIVKSVCSSLDSMSHFKKKLTKELRSSHSVLDKIQGEAAKICMNGGLLLYQSIICQTCTEKCPLCGEQCDMMHGHKDSHHARVHRLQCVNTVKWHKTNKLALKTCNQFVTTNYELLVQNEDPTKNKQITYHSYKELYSDWDIPGEADSNPPLYWMWFVSHFYEDLVSWSGAVETKIPSCWKEIGKSKAIYSLAQAYGLYYSKNT